ncbi:hypothetical protein [Blastomonas sp. AAP25]|uniref:hypothetical protein n=1 Tax=Blastomonas sp. AAP25 TaxID=1523416 RepID=UPI0012E0CE60|nr:hypothetical protein [Blastomonas sp. AAP25]
MVDETTYRIKSAEALISHVGVTSAMVRIMFRTYTGKGVSADEWENLTGNIDELLKLSKELLLLLQEQRNGD